MKLRKMFIAALFVSAILLPMRGFTGALDRGPMQQRYNQAADEMIRVPGVVGMYEQDAMAVLQQAGVAPNVEYAKGYKADLVGMEGTVIDQEPGAAGITMLGSTVTITVYWPPSAGDLPSDSGQYGNTGQGQWEEPAVNGPPPNNQEPAPQWGGGSQAPATGGGWTPPPASAPQPVLAPQPEPAQEPAAPATPRGPAPVAVPRIPSGNVAPSPQPARAVPTPRTPIKATPVLQTVTPVAPRSPAPAATPIQQQLGTKVHTSARVPDKIKRVDLKPKPVNQQQSVPATIVMTPVQQTVTPIFQGSPAPQSQSYGGQTQQDDGSCRSWYAIALDITKEAKRIATELGCAAVEPEPLWKQCIKHIDDIGQWAYFSVHLKKRWNRLVKKTSWAAIGPRDLTFGKTHNGRIFGTTGRIFITPVPIKGGHVNIRLEKEAGKSRTSVTVCSYMPGGDRIKEWYFESPRGNKNKGQVWVRDLSNMDGKLLSIHLDGKSTADTFKYSIFLENN
ncbi:MAG: PASTA domain-containing protein [Deltaproteobacteria bacterium]|nr:PASTA domain-containing protein [Deltaproteobacteria bacterium]